MQREQPKRVFCMANTSLNMACRGDKVILVPADSSDKSQHWIQDYSAVGNLTDDQGARAFALVNRTTGQALVYTYKEAALQLAPYNGNVAVEPSMLWSLGEQQASGFTEVKVLGYPHASLTLNAFGGYPVQDGTVVGTYRSQANYSHAVWKIE